MKKAMMASFALLILAACAATDDDADEVMAEPTNCNMAVDDLKTLENGRPSATDQVLNGVSMVTPVGAAASVVTGEAGDKINVATGGYDDEIDDKVEDINNKCGVIYKVNHS